MNPPTSNIKSSTNLLYLSCMIFSWPLAVLGKLIPVPEIPITECLQTLCCRRRHEGLILQKILPLQLKNFAVKMLIFSLAEKAEETSNDHA